MTPPAELETLRDWLRWAVSRFGAAHLAFGHGTATAYDEAAYLVLHALHLPLDRLEPFLDARLTHPERSDLASLFTRRIEERVPAAYLTREAWLGEFRFYVDEHVIIPRSFIAELLPDGLAPWVGDPSKVQSVLDLCTGSGASRSCSRTPIPRRTSTPWTSRRKRWRSPSTTSAITGWRAAST
jgi:ribosomal protein L3 glutamine methyltransferase